MRLPCSLFVAALCCGLGACSLSALSRPEPPAYFSELTTEGIRYSHNWEARPCFSIQVPGTDWHLTKAEADRITWRRGSETLHVYFTDNREARYAVSGMSPEQALRAFVAYEVEYIRPRFDVQVIDPPRIAVDDNGTWSQWSWEGYGGRKHGSTVLLPADQRHVVSSLWLDPWVLSFDWASTDLEVEGGPRPEMISVIESLQFTPACFEAMRAGETRLF
jgi:hypothetical protein